MVNKTQWTGGLINASSTAYLQAFNAVDLNGLAAGSSVMSSVAAFDNTLNGDQLIDISFVGAIASSTIPAGAAIAFFLYVLQGDNVTYGDGTFPTGGQQKVFAPLLCPLGGFPVQQATGVTAIAGSVLGQMIPPRKFALVCANNLVTIPLAAGGNSCWISTYKQNTNA